MKKNSTYSVKTLKKITTHTLKMIGLMTLIMSSYSFSEIVNVEENIDRGGNDYSHHPDDDATGQSCGNACLQDSACKSWTQNEGRNICYLKNLVGTPSYKFGDTSGYKKEALANDLPTTDIQGNDYKQIFDTSLDICRSSCEVDGVCRAWTFNAVVKNCYLKNGIGNFEYKESDTSGYKKYPLFDISGVNVVTNNPNTSRTIQNLTMSLTNMSNEVKTWFISLDLYIINVDAKITDQDVYKWIGDVPWDLGTLEPGQSQPVDLVSPRNWLFNATRGWSRELVPSGEYRIYAQIRNDSGTIDFSGDYSQYFIFDNN